VEKGEGGEAFGDGGFEDSVMRLIGAFSLDPNRVLDLVLEAMEVCVVRAAAGGDGAGARENVMREFRAVLGVFPAPTVAQMLMFKFQRLAETAGSARSSGAGESGGSVEDLALLIAFLVREGFIDVESLLPYMLPADLEPLVKDLQNYDATVAKAAKNVGVVKLGSTGKPTSAKSTDGSDAMKPEVLPWVRKNRTTHSTACCRWSTSVTLAIVYSC